MQSKPKIIIGADHAGFEMKNIIKEHLVTLEYDVEDVGTFSNDSVDYPDIAQELCFKLLEHQNKPFFGILICGTGIGMSIAANKIKGIRCALCYNQYSAKMARRHNDANIIALGERTMISEDAEVIIETFLNEKYEGERHDIRLNKIDALEQYNNI